MTGAAGNIGSALRERLVARHRLRLFDQAPMKAAESREPVELVQGSVTNLDDMVEACRGIDAVVHLAGIPAEAGWDSIKQVNIDGTRTLFEACRQTGTRRVVFASSNHAVGFRTRKESGPDGLSDDIAAAPDTYYGMSKAAGEQLGALYSARFGMEVVCLRIGSFGRVPTGLRQLATWLSHDDTARLVEAAISNPVRGLVYVWGVSANTARWWSTSGAQRIGYEPQDDAQHWAAELIAQHGEPDVTDPVLHYVGGPFTQEPLGGE